MKNLILLSFLFFSAAIIAQNDNKVKVVGSGTMSDFSIALQTEHFACFEFAHFPEDVNFQVISWEFNEDTETLEKKILTNEKLLKKENSKISLAFDLKDGKAQMITAYISKYTAITPLKFQNEKEAMLFSFKSKPNVQNTMVPIIFATNQSQIPKKQLNKILLLQDMENEEAIKECLLLKQSLKTFKIICYKITKIQ